MAKRKTVIWLDKREFDALPTPKGVMHKHRWCRSVRTENGAYTTHHPTKTDAQRGKNAVVR
jgi:hypothetical protein